jgi:hypothetical protein
MEACYLFKVILCILILQKVHSYIILHMIRAESYIYKIIHFTQTLQAVFLITIEQILEVFYVSKIILSILILQNV